MTSIPKNIRRIEADRQHVERGGIALASGLGRTAFRHAAAAIRLGHDPVNASRDVLLGNRAINQRGIAPILAQTMLIAHLRGRRRTMLEATRRGSIELSAAEDQKKRKRDEEMLIALLLLDDDEVQVLRAQYARQATALTQALVNPVLDRLAGIAKDIAKLPTPRFEAVFQPTMTHPAAPATTTEIDPEIRAKMPAGDVLAPSIQAPSIPVMIRQLGVGYAKAGVIPGYSHSLNNTFGAATVQAYEQGRWSGWQKPTIQEALWGFHYSAVLDSETTELCETLNGMIAPKDDGVWKVWTPPNHWGCRSCIIEVWKSSALREPEVVQIQASPEQMDRFRAMKEQFEKYF